MPIYEYQCLNCGKIIEVLQRAGENPTTECPLCLGETRRIISPAGFILKGEGFYVNDYPSESRKKGIESEKKDTKPKITDTKKDQDKKDTKNITESRAGA